MVPVVSNLIAARLLRRGAASFPEGGQGALPRGQTAADQDVTPLAVAAGPVMPEDALWSLWCVLQWPEPW
jgi:hypothetical protein